MISKDNSGEFLHAIERVLQDGLGFVPLIGAGLSAPSGVPIIRDVHDYLRRCIARALGIDHLLAWTKSNDGGTDKYHQFRRWTPGLDRWPLLDDVQQFGRDTERWDERLHEILDELATRYTHTQNKHPEHAVFQEAYGAMADWRAALLFLARLHRRVDNLQNNHASRSDSTQSTAKGLPPGPMWYLGEQRADVIDTFFLSVILGREPTLGHRMLARLLDNLRVDTVLTTNFDNLMERACAEIGRPVTVFDVHKDAGLPPYEDIRAGNALVKLHGGRYGLRADYSLDALPDDEDRRRFVSYLARRVISQDEWDRFRTSDHRPPVPTRRHLLVTGISGKDQRITALIRTATQILSGLEVFWLCFTLDDERDAIALRAALAKRAGESHPKELFRFHILRHQFVGLFFQHLLQHLTSALPASGIIFPSGPRLPVPPQPFPTHYENNTDKSTGSGKTDVAQRRAHVEKRYVETLRTSLDQAFAPGAYRPRLLLATSKPDTYGIVSCAAKVFEQEINDGRQCVWLDLDEITSADDLYEQMLHAIARKAGISDWRPVILDDPSSGTSAEQREPGYFLRARIREIQRLTNNPQRDWVLFLNARDGAGTNALGFRLRVSADADYDDDRKAKWPIAMPNGWLDFNGTSSVGSAELEPNSNGPAVVHMLQSFCGYSHSRKRSNKNSGCLNLAVVVLCHESPGITKKRRNFVDFVTEPEIQDRLHRTPFSFVEPPVPIPLNESCTDYLPQTTVQDAITWVQNATHDRETKSDSLDRARFLYALCVTNRTRYASLLWSWAYHGGRPGDDVETRLRREKTTFWLNQLAEINVIRQKPGGFIWMHSPLRNDIRTRLETEPLPRPDNPGTIGEYLRTHIHHALAEWWTKLFLASNDANAAFEAIYHRCFRVACLLQQPPDHSDRTSGLEKKTHQAFFLSEARNDLVAIHRLLAQGKEAMLVSGFPKGSCRRLEAIRQFLVDEVETRVEKLKPKHIRKDLYDILDRVYYASIRLNRALAQEVAENRTAIKRQWQLLWWMKYSATEGTPNRRRRNDFDAVFSDMISSPDTTPQDGARFMTSLLRIPHIEDELWREDIAVFLETSIELGTLGIGIRSYRYAEKWLRRARNACGLGDAFMQYDNRATDYRVAIGWWAEEQTTAWLKRKPKRGNLEQTRVLFYRILKVVQREQQLFLLKGRTRHVFARRAPTKDESEQLRRKANKDFKRAEWWYRYAVEIQRFVARSETLEGVDSTLSGLDEARVRDGFDDRQRLLTQCAVAHSFRNQDFSKAHRRLAEAESNLSQSGHGAQSIEMAIIELHRAEVMTHQVVMRAKDENEQKSFRVENLSDFGRMRSQVLNVVARTVNAKAEKTPQLPHLVQAIQSEFLHGPYGTTFPERDDFTVPRAFVADGFQALLRAEPLLKYNRKNVWWSTWFFELEIKLVELRLFMTLGHSDIEYPLPFLGPQAAAIGTPTMPDRLIDDAVRMIRFDVFRLSRIVESYANCLLAMKLWRYRCITSNGQVLPSTLRDDLLVRHEALRDAQALFARQKQMESMLGVIRVELSDRLEIRKSLATVHTGSEKSKRSSTDLDADVLKNAEWVCDYAKRVAEIPPAMFEPYV